MNSLERPRDPKLWERNFALYWLGTFLAASISISSLAATVDASSIRIQPTLTNGLAIWQDGALIGRDLDMRTHANKQLKVGELTIGAREIPNVISLSHSSRALNVRIDGLDKWSLLVPAGDAAVVRVDGKLVLADVTIPATNSSDATMKFGDTSELKLPAGSFTRFDLFPDKSYYAYGGLNLSAQNEESLQVMVSSNRVPLTDGPLVRINDGPKAGRTTRLTPTIDMIVNGQPGSPLDIRMGTNRIVLGPNQTNRTDFPNGSAIQLEHRAAEKSFYWHAVKGDFRVHIHEVPDFEAITLTEQEGFLTWETNSVALAYTNASAINAMALLLPDGSIAVAAPGADVHLKVAGSTSYTLSSDSGGVKVTRADAQWGVYLDKRPVLFTQSGPMRDGKPVAELTRARIALNWDAGTSVSVSGLGKTATLDPGSSTDVDFDVQHRIHFRVFADGEVIAESMDGSYELNVAPVQNSRVELNEGESVAMMLDRKKGLWGLLASETNRRALTISASGLPTKLPPRGLVFFSIGETGVVGIAPDGSLRFTSRTFATRPQIGSLVDGELPIRIERENGIYSVFVGDRLIATSQSLASGGATLMNDLVEVVASNRGRTLQVRPWKQEARIAVIGFPDFNSQVPKGMQITLSVNESIRYIDLAAASDNIEKLQVNVRNSASVELRAGEMVRYDVFTDHSFVFSSENPVIGRTGDGFVIRLGSERPEHFAPTPRPTEGAHAISPATGPMIAMKFNGTIGSPILIKAGTNSLALAPGETNVMTFPNSTRVEFEYRARTRTLFWSVVKGDIHLSVSVIADWEATFLTGEMGELTWDNTGNLRLLTSGDLRPVLVSLPEKTWATVLTGQPYVYQTTTDRPQREKLPTQRINVEKRPDGYAVYIGSRLLVTTSSSDLLPMIFPTDGIFTAVDHNGGGLIIGGIDRDVQVSVARFPGLTATITSGDQVSVNVDTSVGLVDLATSYANHADIEVKLEDGTLLTTVPGRTIRYDLFRDRSYYFVANRRVKGISRDGQSLLISGELAPHEGGPLERIGGTNATAHYNPLTPDIGVKISGNLGSALSILVGTNSITLGPGETNRLTFPNGSIIDFDYGSRNQGLLWSVTKGDFRFEVTGIPEWKAVGLSGQSGRMIWDASKQSIDIKNTSPGKPVLVILPTKTSAIVASEATFQYSGIGPSQFATGAVGGAVSFVNTLSGRTLVELEETSVQVVDGKVVRSSDGIIKGFTTIPVNLSWDAGAPLQFNGGGTSTKLEPNSDRILDLSGDTKLEIKYASKGEMTAEVISGKVQLGIAVLNGLQIDVSEGEVVSLVVDTQKGFFSVKAGQNNSSTISVRGGGGTDALLPPDGNLTLNQNRNGLITITRDGTLDQATEPAGANRPLGGSSTTSTSGTTPIDTSRITQSDVSTFGRQ